VTFQVLVNGQPLVNTTLQYELQRTNGSVSSSARTDLNGFIRVEHDYFVDPAHPITNVSLSTMKMKKPGDVWVSTKSPPPQDLNSPIIIQAKTQRLTVYIQPPPGVGAPALMTIVLKSSVERSYGTVFENISESISMPLTSPLDFPALQPGRYRLQVQVPGAVRWISEDIEIDAKPVETRAILRRGADVHIVLTPPRKDPLQLLVPFSLLQNGKMVHSYLDYDYDVDSHIFRGLPPAQYTLKVPGNAEALARRRSQNEQIPESAAYLGTEVNFTITENSPPFLDLGTLELESATR
jgi:hypothetical protein